jgi:hypothetical protein
MSFIEVSRPLAVVREGTELGLHSWLACTSEYRPNHTDLQTELLARRHRVRPELVALIAELAFSCGRSSA